MTYPIAADPKREIISLLNMVDPDEKDSSGNNLHSRALSYMNMKRIQMTRSQGLFGYLKQF